MSIVGTLTRGLATAASIVLAPFTLAAPTDFDREFVTRASAANEAEVAMARAAATRTNNAGVRVFAKKMIEDHSKANAALAKLASAQGLKLSPPTPEQRSALRKLESLKGEKFDREYARIQQRSHAEAMLLFKRQAGGPGAPVLIYYEDSSVLKLVELF
jgi:putative membrane protein